MKICLVTTPIRPNPTTFPPFGSMAIIQSLKSIGEKVSFFHIDYFRYTYDEIEEYFKNNQFDMVGVSAVVSTAYSYTKYLTSIIKNVSKKTVIFLGGGLAASAEILHRKANIDYCVIGDGEIISQNLVKAVREKKTSDEDLQKIFLSALKSAFYTFVRKLYNYPSELVVSKQEYNAIFLFIRMYCYSGMFRYNAQGKFNVPYGGIGYNNNSLKKKIDYYSSSQLVKRFEKTSFENFDFEKFFSCKSLSSNDFIFLDPPYDSEFSTYAQNEFGRNDQIRLAKFLLNDVKAKWMLVIKSTEFIMSLYKDKNLNISVVDKKYNVSFMDRNVKDVTHLIIRNYE